MSNAFITIIRQDIRLACRQGGSTLHLLGFFTISAVLFAFGVGSEPQLLQSIGAGVIWVCALLSSLLSIPKIFDEDFDDGTLAQILLQGTLPEVVIMAKIASHWLISSLPLVLIAPLLATLFHIESSGIPLIIALLIGTPTLSAIGAIGAALTLGLKRGGGLLGIIILPLYIPVLIFGVAATTSPGANIMILLGLLLLMLPVSIVAATLGVKLAVGE